MSTLSSLKSFLNDESGVVTVDWVVLTSAVVGVGIVVMNTIGAGIDSLGHKIIDDLNSRAPGYTAPTNP